MKKTKSTEFSIRNKHNCLAFLVCCVILCTSLSLAACGKDDASKDDITSEKNTASITNTTQKQGWVYVPEAFTVEDERADYERMQPVGDTFCYMLQGGEEAADAKTICRYSLTERNLITVPVNWPEGGSIWDLGIRFFMPDMSVYFTANVYPADSGSMRRFLCKFDSEGSCLFSKDITEQAGINVSLHGLNVDGQGRLYIFADNEEILLYTGEGDYQGSISCSVSESQLTSQIIGSYISADGKVYVCIGQEGESFAGEQEKKSIRCNVMEVDFENDRLLKIIDNIPDVMGICAGGMDDPYDFLLYDSRAVYGYDIDTQKSNPGSSGEELFTWMDSEINGYCVKNLYQLDDGRLCATVQDWENNDNVIVALKRTEAQQAPQREELTLVTVNGGSNLAAMAAKFNRSNSQYHLNVKSYESLNDLYNAVLIKEPVDLIDLSGVNVEKLTARGLLEDLNPYVEQSDLFERSDFLEGLLDAYTFDNTLAGIPAEFMFRTVVGHGSQIDNKAGLTLEELFSIETRYSGTKALDGLTREEMMQYIMMFNEDIFIDWDSGVCRFDSQEFKSVLEYVSQFPDSVEKGAEAEIFSEEIQNGKVLFAVAELDSPMALRDYVKMFGEDTACVGFPTADGKGGHLLFGSGAYAIAAVSEYKEGAWSFIEQCLTQEKMIIDDLFICYPALKSTLNERVENARTKYGDEYDWNHIDTVLKLLPDAMPYFSAKEDEIINIICEEAPACYSGQKSIDDVAQIIQNRIQAYVSQNK